MNNKERVLKVIKHELPDRIPAHAICIDDPKPYLECLKLENYEQLMEHFGFDLRSIYPLYKKQENAIEITSPFKTSGGLSDYSESTTPRLFAGFETAEEINSYSWPCVEEWDFKSFTTYTSNGMIPVNIESYYGKYAIMAGGWNPVFCQVLDFFGFENALVQLCLNPKLIEATVAHIEEFYLEFYMRFFESLNGKADIFNMGDDFATQRGMMISPEQWRKYFKPTYKRIFELAKKYGLYVWFHSCGAIKDVLPDLIDIGLDVWETVQVHLPGNEVDFIKREYGRNITFFGAVTTQSTLPFGTPEQVRSEVRERIKVLGINGGYICGPDHSIKVDVPIQNTLALYDEIKNFRYMGCTL